MTRPGERNRTIYRIKTEMYSKKFCHVMKIKIILCHNKNEQKISVSTCEPQVLFFFLTRNAIFLLTNEIIKRRMLLWQQEV